MVTSDPTPSPGGQGAEGVESNLLPPSVWLIYTSVTLIFLTAWLFSTFIIFDLRVFLERRRRSYVEAEILPICF